MKNIFFVQNAEKPGFLIGNYFATDSSVSFVKRKRVQSIDLLRGIVMIIMALDHVRDYFHADAFLYSPTDLTQTNPVLFFTRFLTHYCAPVFVFLAGISAYLYGVNKSKRELAYYLFTRGLWMVFTEIFIISLIHTFNPAYHMVNLQVIWAIGISMIVLSAMIYMNKQVILLVSLLLIAGHNILDQVHFPGTGTGSIVWSILHDSRDFTVGRFTIFIRYPVIPWIAVMAFGYYLGGLYDFNYDPEKRKLRLFILGSFFLGLFLFLRLANIYGDAAHWSFQKNILFTLLSFINVTKYPPSFLYVLVTLGPAMIFLALAEKPLNSFTKKVTVFGRVPYFYYLAHLFLIHLFAMFGAHLLGYNWSDMILTTRVNSAIELKGYGFSLAVVYFVWFGLIIVLYPCCKWYANYKRANQSTNSWLTYI